MLDNGANILKNKKVWKPNNVANAWPVDFPKFGGRGARFCGRHWWCQTGQELLQATWPKLLRICCGFASVLKLNFGFPNLGNGSPYESGPS